MSRRAGSAAASASQVTECRVRVGAGTDDQKICGADASHRVVVVGQLARVVTFACNEHVERVERVAKNAGHTVETTLVQAKGGDS